MNAGPDQPFDEKSLRIALAKSGVIKDSSSTTLTPYPAAFARRSLSRRWHYQVSSQNQVICHLIVGLDLGRVHAQAEKFFAACPELVCRPLQFWQDDDGLGYLCLEHFDGTSLDSLVEQGLCSAEQWIAVARKAQNLLEETTRNASTPSLLEQEITDLISALHTFPGITSLDQVLLRDLVQPTLLSGRLSEPLTTRWSNGDFIGRNLLVDNRGGLRLIDYEFAAPTHFGEADWLRLLHFSVRPPQLDESTIPELNSARKPWHEIWFWLHQFYQLRNAEPSEAVDRHLTDTVVRLLAAVNQAIKTSPVGKPASLLLNSLTTQHSTISAMLKERTAWAQSLEKEVARTGEIVSQQKQLIEERLVWIRSLEQELQNTRTTYHDQCKLADERTAWARSLEAEIQKLRTTLAEQATLTNERTVWAQTLETELQKARTAFLDQGKLADERTAWALSLEAERLERLKRFEELRAFCSNRAILLPNETGAEEAVLFNRCRTAITDLQRDVEQKKADTIAASGSILENQLKAEVAEAETVRLTNALTDAQQHVDHLLEQVKNLQLSTNSLAHDKLVNEETLRQCKRELSSAIAQLRVTRSTLERYENNWISRFVARFSNSQSNTSSEP